MKRNIRTIGAIIALALLLVGAAFVGGQLIQAQQRAQANNNQNGPLKLVTLAPEMPTTAADGRGEVTNRDGNSIIICESHGSRPISKVGGLNDESCDSVVEVVITHETVLFRDVTDRQYGNETQSAPGEAQVFNQVVEPGTQDDLGVGAQVMVWGPKSGNRITADTLLYWYRPGNPADS